MIKTKLQKVIVLSALCLVVLVSALALTLFKPPVSVDADHLVFDKELALEYALGDSLTPPSAKIIYANKEYDAQVKSVTFPDGRSYKAEKYILSATGKYSVNYSADTGNGIVSCSVDFNVFASTYSVSSSNSTVYYGSIENTDADGTVLKDEQGNAITTSGIKVSLSAGDTFTYKKPINLAGKTKFDNIISLYSLPEILGKADARILKVRLTDAYDENNYVDVVTYGNYGDEDEKNGWALYSGAGANGQPLTGLHFYASSNERTFTYQGQLYTHNENISYNSANGYPSFEYSLSAKKGYGAGVYTLSMNYEEKQLFGCKTIAPSSNGMIIDLDEPLFFENLWGGFTTGEVYLSVSADNYVGNSFSFIITNILGEDISKNTFLDKVVPKLDVEIPTDIPSAIINRSYKLFDATAMDDIDGALDVNVVVYRNYYSSNPVMVNVSDDSFIPTEKGVYTIVYKTTDRSGNEKTINVDVQAKEKSELKVELSACQTSVKAGEVIALAKPVVKGNDGKYSLTVSVVSGNEKTKVLPNEKGEYLYQCMKAGEYKVEYVCVDYNVTVTEEYSFTVDKNPTPTIISDATLPPVFVNGVEYKLPSLIGYDFSSGNPVEKTAKIYYAFDGGNYTESTDGKIKVNAKEVVKIKYSLGDASLSNREYVIAVTDVGMTESKYVRSKYFYGTGFTVNANKDLVSYSSNEDYAKLTFVNSLLTTDFSLKYQLKETNLSRVVFTFTDCANSANKLNVALKVKDTNSYYVSVNGAPETIVSQSINDSTTLSYKDDEKLLTISGLSFDLKDFDGFIGKLAWLNIEFIDNDFVNFIVSEINGQKINSDEIDNAAPMYSIKVNSDEKSLGEEIVVSRFIAGDVLKFNAKCYLTVYGPDGKPCVSVDGVTMKDVTDFSSEHVIKINALGIYKIVGYATDGARRVNVSRQVVVKDNVAPTITFSNVNTTAKVGDVKIAKYTVEDNGTDVFVTVCVQCPDMSMINVSGDKFSAKEKGTYTVMVFATDETGNVGFNKYEVVVR